MALKLKKARKAVKFDYDKVFQGRLLRVLFQDPDFTSTTGSFLSPKHFEKRLHRWLADKILAYAKKHGHGIAQDALKIELDRDIRAGVMPKDQRDPCRALIEKLERTVKDKSYIKEELFKFVKNRVTETALLNSLDHLDSQDFTAIDAEFTKVLEVQESLSGGLGQFFIRDINVRTKRRKKYEKNGISSGLKLDDFLKPGGLPPKALGVVVAPSGKGKSHCLVHIGKSAIIESNAKVLHVTLELSEDFILDRYDAAFSGIPLNRLEDKSKQVRKAVREIGAKYGDCLVVKEFPPATLTVPALRAYIRQLERVGFYPDMVIVDYADEMLPSVVTRDKNAYVDMGTIYRELRRLSYEIGAPIWTASQTQRAALNKEHFDWDAISDSAQKVMVADLVICLMQTLAEKKHKQARFWVAKSRFGSDKFDFKVRLDWSRSTIRHA